MPCWWCPGVPAPGGPARSVRGRVFKCVAGRSTDSSPTRGGRAARDSHRGVRTGRGRAVIVDVRSRDEQERQGGLIPGALQHPLSVLLWRLAPDVETNNPQTAARHKSSSSAARATPPPRRLVTARDRLPPGNRHDRRFRRLAGGRLRVEPLGIGYALEIQRVARPSPSAPTTPSRRAARRRR